METLILVPTPVEHELLRHELSVPAEICGFGLVAAAARTTQLLASIRPRRAILVGIAGGYDDTVPIGSAIAFDEVVCEGIGVGAGNDHQSASQMGFAFYQDAQHGRLGDRLDLSNSSPSRPPGLLLSCASASADAVDTARRLARFPAAIAEDMEGFAVAFACRLAGVPLTIIRGISNQAGDRNHDRWQIAAAMASASEILRESV